MKFPPICTVLLTTTLFVGCDYFKNKKTENKAHNISNFSCTDPDNLNKIQINLKAEYIKVIEKNLRQSSRYDEADQNLLEKINKGLRFEIKTIRTLTEDIKTAKELNCESQMVVSFPKGLIQRAENAYQAYIENVEVEGYPTVKDYLDDNESGLTVTDDELRGNFLYSITKTDKEGLSLSVQNQKEILEDVAFITKHAVLFESYVKKNKEYHSIMQDNDQKYAAQYNLAKQAMDIRKKELEAEKQKQVERLNQTWDNFTEEQRERFKQDQADWFEKRDIDCKVIAQKPVYEIPENERETYQKQSDYWDEVLNDQNIEVQYTKCFNQRTIERVIYLNNLFN
ncbi:DUF1311 domain-containing protein [Acinetobacter sp. S40]|uniref:DUF1311 domain-containing protein n=1 Tax=unclassified Acinetobacter TaxID=196816 RepID=UPI00190AFFDC|nr:MULTISPECIES: DUF1311 domain-containing protein [unclassified Acinetobacter]MBJ9984867.1 DUF1311 domain-containing protein [Acinetobacter sp. S40]MBK0063142.1 DUF1311 domain-containing protein [Acinetobacter sp. S55]MBK0066440.1 DUF1311 domain-containing protein [Acinetobacter sp. S54]